MARFDQPQDPLFARINASIGFDLRLWPQDVEGSRAHVGALHRAGVVDDGERDALLAGLDAVAGELAPRRVRASATTTRTSTWRSSAG